MNAIVSAYSLAIPVLMIWMVVLLVKSLRKGFSSWRDTASWVALGTVLVSAGILGRHVIPLALWGDCSATAESVMAMRFILEGSRWGMWLACIGTVAAIFARGWARIVPFTGSVFFASFWVYSYKLLEAR